MIGMALKKCAAELGLGVQNGVAYGEYKGYMLTMKEGSGWKSVAIAANFPDANSREAAEAAIDEGDFKKAHRIQQLEITEKLLTVVFIDNPGTMPKLKDALEIILGKLSDAGIPGMELCSNCGNPIEDGAGKTVFIAGNVYYMHDACVSTLTNQLAAESEEIKGQGSVAAGVLGAVLGAIVGAIPWAVAYYFGWFVGWLGFLIGIAAKKGYELFKGKETKAKGIVIILVVLISVVFAEYATLLITWIVQVNSDPELSRYGLTVVEIMQALNATIATESELLSGMIKDILIGWLFAGLGVIGTIKQVFTDANRLHTMPSILPDANSSRRAVIK